MTTRDERNERSLFAELEKTLFSGPGDSSTPTGGGIEEPFVDIDMNDAVKHMVYDIGSIHPECLLEYLGFERRSDEVITQEWLASADRLGEIDNLDPLIMQYSILLTSILISAQHNLPHLEAESEEEADAYREHVLKTVGPAYFHLVYASVRGTLTFFKEHGLINLAAKDFIFKEYTRE